MAGKFLTDLKQQKAHERPHFGRAVLLDNLVRSEVKISYRVELIYLFHSPARFLFRQSRQSNN
ncbi:MULTISPECIES: hypothetical protein [unclassified Methylobacterium]|uniref:hypothetical protein n=1 Tax=unclassified Methylobacterium TaxID=2615210 RepID=UPI0011C81312|nr:MULTISPECIES: hypothetical protein [unclassified Methylobacterium]TXM66858.1 hypothetical protein FV229_11570 [Methylobacterium sp. WL120]TXN83009.1 hypothetical protein FV234_08260 [Methylobacterium sp. WL8]